MLANAKTDTRQTMARHRTRLFNRTNLAIVALLVSLLPVPNGAAPTLKIDVTPASSTSETAMPSTVLTQSPETVTVTNGERTTETNKTTDKVSTLSSHKTVTDETMSSPPLPVAVTTGAEVEPATERPLSTLPMQTKIAESSIVGSTESPLKIENDREAEVKETTSVRSTPSEISESTISSNYGIEKETTTEMATAAIISDKILKIDAINRNVKMSTFDLAQTTTAALTATSTPLKIVDVTDERKMDKVESLLSTTLTSLNDNGQTSTPKSLTEINDASTTSTPKISTKLKTPSNENDDNIPTDSGFVTSPTTEYSSRGSESTNDIAIEHINQSDQIETNENGTPKIEINVTPSTISSAPTKSNIDLVTAMRNHHVGKIIKSSDVEKLTRKHNKATDHNNKKHNFKVVNGKEKSKKKLSSHDMDVIEGDTVSPTTSSTIDSGDDVMTTVNLIATSHAIANSAPESTPFSATSSETSTQLTSEKATENSIKKTLAVTTTTVLAHSEHDDLIQIITESVFDEMTSTPVTQLTTSKPILLGEKSTSLSTTTSAVAMPAAPTATRPNQSILDYDKSSEEIFDIVHETTTTSSVSEALTDKSSAVESTSNLPLNSVVAVTTAPATATSQNEKPHVIDNDEFFLPADDFDSETTITAGVATPSATPLSPTAPVSSSPSTELPGTSSISMNPTIAAAASTTVAPSKESTAERDSDTIFYISNTEVKVVESPMPTPNTKEENRFFPALYEEDVIIDFHSKNNSGWSSVNGDKYEEDIILSPMKSNFDPSKLGNGISGDGDNINAGNRVNPGINFVGESFIDLKDSSGASGSDESSADTEISSNVIIEPIRMSDVVTPQSINVPIIKALPPQIEIPNSNQSMNRSIGDGSFASEVVSHIGDSLQKAEELIADLPKTSSEEELSASTDDVVIDIGSVRPTQVVNITEQRINGTKSNKTRENELPLLSTPIPKNETAKENVTAEPIANATAFTIADEDSDASKLFQIENCLLVCHSQKESRFALNLIGHTLLFLYFFIFNFRFN